MSLNATQFITNLTVIDAWAEGWSSADNGIVSLQRVKNSTISYHNRPKRIYAGNAAIGAGWFGYEHYATANATLTLPEAENHIGLDLYFTNPDAITLRVSPSATDTILWLGIAADTDAILIGASDVLHLKAIADNTWNVEFSMGTVYPDGMTATGSGQPGIVTGVATPVAAVTPRWIGEMYFDSVAVDMWVSTGLTNNDWKQTTP